MNHKGTKILQTDRLILRPFTAIDGDELFFNVVSNESVVKYLMWPMHSNILSCLSLVSSWVERYNDSSYYNWAITLKNDTQQLIGSIIVNNKIDLNIKSAQIGFCIGENWWHLGITSEALERVMEFLFFEVGVNRIECKHDPRNTFSGEVMKKCGMTYEGTLRQADFNNQGLCDASFYSMLKSEWACFYDKKH